MLSEIIRCFEENKLVYSEHAKNEMRTDKFGRIYEAEVFEAISQGKIIANYPEDKPYPSVLIYGRTQNGRPLHIVCAWADKEGIAIVITVYHPDPQLWVDYKTRRKR